VSLLACLALASSSPAAPPAHLPIGDPVGGFPLNHACGTAVDSEGNVYVSNASESKVEVFDPSGAHLASVAVGNEPCGLAVDGHGDLFVTEKATGKVVRYVPGEYPFSVAPSYGGPEAIDASGNAMGIAVDASPVVTNSSEPIGRDDSLYIAKGDHIDAYRNETQRVQINATGGTYTLSFAGDVTEPLSFSASHKTVEDALEALTTIGPNDVSVTTGNFSATDHLVRFSGTLGLADVSQFVIDSTNLIGTVNQDGTDGGLVGPIVEMTLANYSGVAAYTYQAGGEKFRHFVFAADVASDEVRVFSGPSFGGLKLRQTIGSVDHDHTPGTADQVLGFGSGGAYLAADPGNRAADGKCAQIAEQACTAGHFFVYDASNSVVDEFDATGGFLDQVSSDDFADAAPTGLAVERSGGPGDGTLYVTAGSGPAASLLAFGPLANPSRPPLPQLSHVLVGAAAVAVDSHGDVYAAAGPAIQVFGPSGQKLAEIPDVRGVRDLAVDSDGNVYVVDGSFSDRQMTYYSSGAYPPVPGAVYARHEPAIIAAATGLEGVTVNPSNDRVLALWTSPASSVISEFDAAGQGSAPIRECGAGLSLGLGKSDIGVYGANGQVYVAANPRHIYVVDCGPAEGSEEVVGDFEGEGCPNGKVGANPAIAVDQSNGHVLEFESLQAGGMAREYDAAGSCVAEFGRFGSNGGSYAIAMDSSGGANDGNVYVAYDATDNAIQPFDITAFGRLAYGEAPAAVTGIASGLGGGKASLNGTVDPGGFLLSSCSFEYLTDTEYIENGKTFAGASSIPCTATPAEIGPVTEPVPVMAEIGGLDPEERYRFRLATENKYGGSVGKAGLFGAPVLASEEALPILQHEVTLRGEIDPSGLATTYHFDYGPGPGYGQSTSPVDLPPGDGAVPVQKTVTGLAAGTEYHFRLVAENEAKKVEGPDLTFRTLQDPLRRPCPNTEYRTGLSANLPDCRAYELVTPADTRGQEPGALPPGSAGNVFNNWLVNPRGAGAGESVAFFAGTLPGFDGTGDNDGYRAARTAGSHPVAGWTTEFYGPSYAQLGGGSGNNQEGVSADQRFWLWHSAAEIFPALLPLGHYLRTPDGEANPACNTNDETFQDEFELVGCGTLGVDPAAESRFVSAAGAHIVFSSDKQLEAGPASGTRAIYDRAAGEANAEVVSVDPAGDPLAADATYVGASEDGSAVVFVAGGTLYVHRAGVTVGVAQAPYTFAGISEDGTRVLFLDATVIGDPPPAGLFVCDVEVGPCLGAVHPGLTTIATNSIFVNVSADGSGVLFTSKEAFTGSEENEAGEEAQAGEPNLYAWDGSSARFVAVLDAEDFLSFGNSGPEDMLAWAKAVGAGPNIGRANSPTRATPGGEVFLFQSHAQLTAYDNDGFSEIYRYEPDAVPGEQLSCVSCDPSNAPASGDALLQIFVGGHTEPTTMVPNVTDDGRSVFFNSPDRLLSEDANNAVDVYEWKARGAGEGAEKCERAEGCLDLISSGQGEGPSTLYGMSADGHDVFFSTAEELAGADIPDSVSIYDAREEGGIPDPPDAEVCHGDACQGQGDGSPALIGPATTVPVPNGNVRPNGRRCPRGKQSVKRKGKLRCVAKRRGGKHRGRSKKHAADHHRRVPR